MSEKLTILFIPMEGVGHVNACIGFAEVLQSRGHKIVFVAGKAYEGKLTQYGFAEEILNSIDESNQEQKMKPGEQGAQQLLTNGLLSGATPYEKMERMQKGEMLSQHIDKLIGMEPIMRQIIAKHKTDVIVIDHFVGLPSVIYTDKPWILLCSGNPLFYLVDDRTPPAGSGFASNSDRKSKEWIESHELRKKFFEKPSIKYNQYLLENGYSTIDGNRCIPDSPFLNIYGYPEELDYLDIRPLPDKWMRVDAFMRRSEPDPFEIPEKLKNRNEKTQKLIYLSLGSMGSIDIQLMKRLINILSKSSHKYIISKGLLGDKYELADNMWGQNSVPQTKVLPLIDLVITHGGNNTVTETFSFGKPMIVMPLVCDQYDNAQRIYEKGFGLRLDPYDCTEDELLGAVEKLLNDKSLIQRLNVASKRILNSDSIQKVSEVIEKIAKKSKI